jgi:hypothetical protein
MQMQLPFFPDKTKLLSPSWGIFKKDGFVYYLHNGSPVYTQSTQLLQQQIILWPG